MAQADPFAVFADEPTVMGPPPDDVTPSPNYGATAMEAPLADEPWSAGGLNPLVAAANPLLVLVPQLRTTAQHRRPLELREEIARQIHRFEERARAAALDPQTVLAARYVLCTLIDEVAASTPWGGSGVWARQSLLVAFHNEAQGGEKFFVLLARLAENPARYIDLLELAWACLALGFEGRYRLVANGRAQLDALRDRLATLIAKHRPPLDPELSVNWKKAVVKRRGGLSFTPIWVPPVMASMVLVIAWMRFNENINAHSDPVFQRIVHIRAQSAAHRTTFDDPDAPAPQAGLARFLAPEIERDLLAVVEAPGRSVVTLRGDALFASGSATIDPRYAAIIDRIAAGLQGVPGRILVTGHTDDTPINTLRYPSNWHLATDRARSVQAMIGAAGVAPDRIRAEGRGAAEPLTPNDSAEHRARNRRVEITLFTAGGIGTALHERGGAPR